MLLKSTEVHTPCETTSSTSKNDAAVSEAVETKSSTALEESHQTAVNATHSNSQYVAFEIISSLRSSLNYLLPQGAGSS